MIYCPVTRKRCTRVRLEGRVVLAVESRWEGGWAEMRASRPSKGREEPSMEGSES